MEAERAQRKWKGIEVAITGRLASMPREEAIECLERAGARLVAQPGESTAVLVVGQGGPALGEDGRLTTSLRVARELRAAGAAIDILSESEFLDQLGLEEKRGELERLFTTTQLARILSVSPQRIRTWVRHGLIHPAKTVRRLSFFDFQQVATARTLSQLCREGVTPQRIRKSLEELSEWLPETERSLTQLETLEHSDVLVVRTEEGQLAETSGQLRLDFDTPPIVEPRRPRPVPSDDWFEAGVSYEEEGRLGDAVRAYAQALRVGGPRPEVHFNLGNVLFSLEEKSQAARHFQLAVDLDPDYVEAWNNLGNALAELGRADEAIVALTRALDLEPGYADAHFNLAETLANLGEYEGARRHWRAYLELDPGSTWAGVVRERLRRTEPRG